VPRTHGMEKLTEIVHIRAARPVAVLPDFACGALGGSCKQGENVKEWVKAIS
jgi:hypothetical protein